MKKVLAVLLALVMILPVMVACKKDEKAAANDVEMKFMSVEDLKEKLGDKEYTILDVRQKENRDKGYIEGSIHADMDVVVNGNDTAKGLEIIKKAIEGVDNNIVLVCNSGKRYAQVATNALKEAGYDMTKVTTLEGGMKAWDEKFPNETVK